MIEKENFPNVIRVKSKRIDKAVFRMHPDLDIPAAEFRRQWEIVYRRLLPVYFKNLKGNEDSVGLVIILRAASAGLLAMKERLLKYDMPVFMVWAARNEITIQAQMLNCNLPDEIPGDMPALILDPMCATATSSIMTIQDLKGRGFKDITCIFGVASKDGLKTIRDSHPDVKNIVGFTGPNIGLNEKGYVIYLDTGIPVVGDAGDRWTRITGKGKLLKKIKR
jgi:uracil phosphoribosyltransferase